MVSKIFLTIKYSICLYDKLKIEICIILIGNQS